MKRIALAGLASVLLLPVAGQGTETESVSIEKAAARIDALVEKKLVEEGLQPNESIGDATFVRRAYLDIVGRIPTIEEAEDFHASTYPRKRAQLIRDLLESDGHVSHAYNYWADLLRINDRLGTGATQAEAAYQLYVKEAIAENKPYDQFVHELVSATGKVWDNGAVGYYIRDRGMPLDNMSNTVRLFLGTRLECAQCHNHPFDKWTQMDYFKMAAFSYGMDALRYDTPNRTAMREHDQERRRNVVAEVVPVANFPQIRSEEQLKRTVASRNYERSLERLGITDKQFRRFARKSIAAYADYEHESRGMRTAMNELYNPLRYIQANEREKTLKLPHDYQYDDAAPEAPVEPATMFGEMIDLEAIDESTIDAYATWMTSEENPTFTRVIANRLWKRVFGQGVFEPVDELTDHTFVSNPELLAYLEELMRTLDYDMRTYQEILFNTETYQRGVHAGEIAMGAPYYFPGPVLRRMTAEQIWDSIVALALPEVDGYRPRLKSQLASIEKVRRTYDALEGRPEDEYLEMVREVADALAANQPKMDAVREKLTEARLADDEEAYADLRRELSALQRESRRIVSDIGYRHVGEKVDGDDLLLAMGMTEMAMTMEGGQDAAEGVVFTKLPQVRNPEPPEGMDRKAVQAWKRKVASEKRVYQSLVSKMARASELNSPAPRGHFLREFGQSDREVIENASDHASVPQALNLLNGPIVRALTNEFAVFGHRIHAAGDPVEKTKMIFKAMLTREPTEGEMEIALSEVDRAGDTAYEGLVWALLNTRQFIFVQ